MYMPYLISVSLLESKAEEKSSDGSIANLSNLRDDKVYLFSGTEDTVVFQGRFSIFDNWDVRWAIKAAIKFYV